jgi:NAD(P)-dependent dehydrogenase (short-subunit alcohol dehydrogenase family)
MAGTGRMRGRNALVTGATGGIGRAVAVALAREGATVVVSGRDKERGEEVVRRIVEEGNKAVFVHADLGAGGQAVRDLARDATAAVGAIDVLVNNAAVLVPAQSMLEATEEQIDQALAVNIKAPFLLTAALVPSMVERGSGAVVNMGSVNGEVGMDVAALYGASKAGLHSLTKSWAVELAAKGVRVNTVAPGPTVTEHNLPYKDVLESFTATHPQHRAGTAEEVAAAVVFLAGDDAAHIHGITLPVDGGFLAM